MQITHSLRDYGFERWAGLLTWFMLAAMSLALTTERDGFAWFSPLWLVTAALFVLFIVAFSFATSDERLPGEPRSRFLLLALQLGCVYGLFWLLPFNFIAVLITMWCAQLPYFVTVRTSIIIALVVCLPQALIFQFHWGHSGAWLTALLFWAFHLFAILMMASQLRESRARQREEATNRELRATQALLSEANKQQERTRIARNIHDLLGHHLTALTIQLQVAERKSEGEVKGLLQQSQSIAKLLLADVREAVTEIRSASALPLQKVLQELVYEVPGKRVAFSIPDGFHVRQMEVADAVLRIIQEGITNFMRHSNGDTLKVCVQQVADELVIELQDNGHVNVAITPSNGLRGMQERVAQLGGTFMLTTESGLRIAVHLPMEEQCQ